MWSLFPGTHLRDLVLCEFHEVRIVGHWWFSGRILASHKVRIKVFAEPYSSFTPIQSSGGLQCLVGAALKSVFPVVSSWLVPSTGKGSLNSCTCGPPSSKTVMAGLCRLFRNCILSVIHPAFFFGHISCMSLSILSNFRGFKGLYYIRMDRSEHLPVARYI